MELWEIRKKIRKAYSLHRVRAFKENREPMKRREWEIYHEEIISSKFGDSGA